MDGNRDADGDLPAEEIKREVAHELCDVSRYPHLKCAEITMSTGLTYLEMSRLMANNTRSPEIQAAGLLGLSRCIPDEFRGELTMWLAKLSRAARLQGFVRTDLLDSAKAICPPESPVYPAITFHLACAMASHQKYHFKIGYPVFELFQKAAISDMVHNSIKARAISYIEWTLELEVNSLAYGKAAPTPPRIEGASSTKSPLKNCYTRFSSTPSFVGCMYSLRNGSCSAARQTQLPSAGECWTCQCCAQRPAGSARAWARAATVSLTARFRRM